MAQKSNTDPTDGELDFSDGELSEMGADVAGREPGVKRKRPTLRVPVDQVRRAAEPEAPKVGLSTEPSLPAFQSDASDDVVENAFTAGGVADGDVPCVRDFAEAVQIDDDELEPGGMRPLEIGETEVRTLDADPEGDHVEIETDPKLQAVPRAVGDAPTKPLPQRQVAGGSPLAALVRAVSTGLEPGMAPVTAGPPSLDAVEQPVWSSAPPPAAADARPVLVGETTGAGAERPPSAQALASAVVARAQRSDDEEELDNAELEEDDGAEAEKAAAAARPRTMTPLPPLPPPDRPRGGNSGAIPLNGNGNGNANVNANVNASASASANEAGRAPPTPAAAAAASAQGPSLFAPPMPAAAPPIPASAHAPVPRPGDPSVPNVLPPAAPGGAASPPAVPSLPGMPPPTPAGDGAQARPPVPSGESVRPPATPPAPPAPRDRSLTPNVPVNAIPAAAPVPAAELPLRTRKRRRAKQWYEEIFDDDYLRTLPFLTPRQTEREAQFVTESLGLPSGAAVLDLACGYGRHAMELAGKGYKVTGLDLSLPLLIRAADTARRASLNINFIHGDMREMTFDNEFDGAYSMFTSFGYFDDDTNRKVAGNLARAIKPGGKLLIDVVNRDYLCRDLPTRVWWQGEGCVILEEVDFNYFSSRLQVQRSIIFEDGRQVEQEISIRAYSLHEIGKVLHHSGFRVTEVSGGLALRGKFFGAQSRQLLVLAEKKGQP